MGDHLDDGPKPLFRASDFTHVALSETTGELWLSDPASLVEPDRGDEAVQEPGQATGDGHTERRSRLFPDPCLEVMVRHLSVFVPRLAAWYDIDRCSTPVLCLGQEISPARRYCVPPHSWRVQVCG